MAGRTYGRVTSGKGGAPIRYGDILLDAWDLNQAGQAMRDMEAAKAGVPSNDMDRWGEDYSAIRARYQSLEAAARATELQGAMAASYAEMAAAANTTEPAREPLKAAPEVLQGARDGTLKLQQKRTGLASAFNRYGASAYRRQMPGKKEGLGV